MLGALDVRLCWIDPTASLNSQLQSLLHACMHMLVRRLPSGLPDHTISLTCMHVFLYACSVI